MTRTGDTTLSRQALDSVTKLPPLRSLLDRAASERKRIAFAEGSDPRIVAGALAALSLQAASVALVGPRAEVLA